MMLTYVMLHRVNAIDFESRIDTLHWKLQIFLFTGFNIQEESLKRREAEEIANIKGFRFHGSTS